jgi:hypothetical protein
VKSKTIALVLGLFAAFAWGTAEAKSPEVMSACNRLGDPAKKACLSGGQNSVESVEACHDLNASADQVACFSGGPKPKAAIKACALYGDKDKASCLGGNQNNVESIETCKGLSSQADRDACFLGSPQGKDALKACARMGTKEKLACFK